jgi:hypothetical protein
MTSAVEPGSRIRADLRTILGGGAKLGFLTVLGVVAFALFSRASSGPTEVVIQSLLVLAGGIVFSFAPAIWVRPRDVDSIAWAALVGLLGSLLFTVVDTAILRPLNLYHYTWDEIGGGSGFWYIPVWWMGSATLAWLGAWVYSVAVDSGDVRIGKVVGITVLATMAAFLLLGFLGTGFSPASMGLAFAVGLVIHLIVVRVLRRR